MGNKTLFFIAEEIITLYKFGFSDCEVISRTHVSKTVVHQATFNNKFRENLRILRDMIGKKENHLFHI